MIDVICWKWNAPGYRSVFTAQHVNVLRNMVRRHYQGPHRFTCITDDPVGIDGDIRVLPLWDDYKDVPSPHGGRNPSCYRRLKAFSREAETLIGPRFISIDLDTVIVGDLTPIFDRTEDFVIWGDTATTTLYNGSLWMLKAGARPQVWENFDPVFSPKASLAAAQRGSDQGWIGCCLGRGEARYDIKDGVYSWRVHIKPNGGALPEDARIVNFHGGTDPWDALEVDWIRQHWR